MSDLLFDDEYAGPRWRYGLQYRPLAPGAIPNGWIVYSHRRVDDKRCPFGSVEYPRALTKREVDGYQLLDLGKV